MALLPEWGLKTQGVVYGVVGLAVLLATLFIWRKMEHKAPIRLGGKTLAAIAVGVLGVLLLGVGMCMVLVFERMALGTVIGLVGIVGLLMLIPLLKGLHDRLRGKVPILLLSHSRRTNRKNQLIRM